MKMLVIEIFNVNRGNKDFIRIASQPFISENFYAGDDYFRASNGFCLYSRGCPEIKTNGLYLRGHISRKDNITLAAPTKEWVDKLAQAVREYNNYLEDTGGAVKDKVRDISRKQVNQTFLESLFNVEETIK